MLLLLLVARVAGCHADVPRETAQATASGDSGASPRAVSASPVERPTPPNGFPVLPGARPEALPADDPAAIARWTSGKVGPVAYQFYVEALPAAGYPISGLFPGGTVAIIRFEAPGDATWQLVLTRTGDGTRIEVRLDQP
jgi:hypothetical protein